MIHKRILISGSTDGIGKQTALELALSGQEVIIHGRDPEKVRQTTQEISKKADNGLVDGLTADFKSLDQVRKMVDELYGKYDYLDVLINNAGIYMNNYELSEDGYEMTFAVNHLATFMLSLKLLQLVKRSYQGRIITVASAAHESSTSLDFKQLQHRAEYNAYDAYAQSKLCNVLFCYELHEKLKNTPITSNCLHPGVINTKLLHQAFSINGDATEEGASTSIYLAIAPELENISGKYFVQKKIKRSSRYSYDPEMRKKLWEVSEKLSNTPY